MHGSDTVKPLKLIYARSRNYCIGHNGNLPWDLPDEFAHFRRTILGAPIIMGRKSYQDHNCLLPGSLNIVVSRQPRLPVVEGIAVRTSLSSALELAYTTDKAPFVIGGSGLLAEAFPLASEVTETVVHADLAGDTHITNFSFNGWRKKTLFEHAADRNHAHAFTVIRYSRH